jgi:CHASE3 domain sensor protein
LQTLATPSEFQNERPREKSPRVASQRFVLGTGLATLLAISAASIGLDVKSRSDAAWIDHTLGVLQKFSDLQLLICRAESASRGFVLSNAAVYVREFNESRDRIGPALAELIETTKDNPVQTRLLQESRELVGRRLEVSGEMIRLQTAGDSAAVAALNAGSEGRAIMGTIGANFDKLAADEQRLLAIRAADSRLTRVILLGIDLAGALLILLLAAILIRDVRRSSRTLQSSLSASKAVNESLEAAVAERTEHLLAAHEELAVRRRCCKAPSTAWRKRCW